MKLPIDKNAGRVGRARAARKTEKTPTLRSRSLIRKEVNIGEIVVRGVGLEPTTIPGIALTIELTLA